MKWYKLLDADGQLAGAEEFAEPLFVYRARNGTVINCGEREAQGVVSGDQTQIYQLDGKPEIGISDVALTAVEISGMEYDELVRDLPDPEDIDPVIPDGSDEEAEQPMTRAELTEAVAALEKANTLLTGMLLENREDDMRASKAYSAGDLIIVNGTLYKAISRIASGAALTVNTNVKQTTLAAEIAAANS